MAPRRVLSAVSLCVCVAASLFPRMAFAQATWNGLRFGMTVQEAQATMTAKGTNMVATDPQHLDSSNDFDLIPSGTIPIFPMTVKVRFDNTGLNRIDLQLDLQAYRKRETRITSDSNAIWISSSYLFDALMNRYGRPLTQDGDCKPIPSDPSWSIGCSAHWRADGQTIGYVVSAGSSRALLIEYSPQTNQL